MRPKWESLMKTSTMGQRHIFRSVAATVALSLAVSAVAATGTSAAARPAAPSAKTGGELTVAINETFAGFCYSALVAGTALNGMSTIFESLFLKAKNGDPIGLLASGATSTPDFKTWTITLRSGISYTNGQAFNADSAMENLNYLRGAKYVPPATNLWTLGVAVAGFANVVSITKIDDLSFTVSLFKSQNDFPIMLSGFGMRATAQLATGATCSGTPIGTGPFTMSSWSSTELVVVKNPNYWRRDPARPSLKLPLLDKISFIVVAESSQRAAAVRKKAVDMAFFTGRTDNTYIADLEQRKSVVNVYKSPNVFYPSLYLNQSNGGPFSDLNARLAVVNCIDRANFNKVRLKARGETPTSVLGSLNIGYSKKGFTPFNPTKSKQFVAAYLAANPGKTSLTFTVPFESATQVQNNAKFLQETFTKCGITMNILTEEQAVWAGKAYNVVTGKQPYDALYTAGLTDVVAVGNFAIFATNQFPADSPNPLKAFFRNTLGPLYNLNRHTDTSIDDLLWQGRAASTKASSKAAYQAATQKIQEQGVMTSIANFGWSLVSNKKSKLSAPGSIAIVKGQATQPVSPSWTDWAGLSKG